MMLLITLAGIAGYLGWLYWRGRRAIRRGLDLLNTEAATFLDRQAEQTRKAEEARVVGLMLDEINRACELTCDHPSCEELAGWWWWGCWINLDGRGVIVDRTHERGRLTFGCDDHRPIRGDVNPLQVGR